jgi:hypothetical protein
LDALGIPVRSTVCLEILQQVCVCLTVQRQLDFPALVIGIDHGIGELQRHPSCNAINEQRRASQDGLMQVTINGDVITSTRLQLHRHRVLCRGTERLSAAAGPLRLC